jgi:hypothetical protein
MPRIARFCRIAGLALLPVLIAAALIVVMPYAAAQAPNAVDWSSGTWTVVCKEQPTHSCGTEPGAKTTHLWTVSAESARKLKVTVVGDSEFPTFAGRYDSDTRAFLFDARSAKPFVRGYTEEHGHYEFFTGAFFYLAPTAKDKAVGLRRWTGYKMVPGTYSSNKGYVPCAIHSVCTAKKAD